MMFHYYKFIQSKQFLTIEYDNGDRLNIDPALLTLFTLNFGTT